MVNFGPITAEIR